MTHLHLILAISTHSNCCLFIQLLLHVTDAMEVKKKTNSNECKELFQLLHVPLLQKCLAAFRCFIAGRVGFAGRFVNIF